MSATFQNEVLEQLREFGSDLTKPHDFEFYLYVPTKAYAEKAAKIRSSGFSAAEVSRAASGSGWLCLARKTIIPEHANLSDHARFFEEVAAAVGGDFDGWRQRLFRDL
jgi:hypothetical protein